MYHLFNLDAYETAMDQYQGSYTTIADASKAATAWRQCEYELAQTDKDGTLTRVAKLEVFEELIDPGNRILRWGWTFTDGRFEVLHEVRQVLEHPKPYEGLSAGFTATALGMAWGGMWVDVE